MPAGGPHILRLLSESASKSTPLFDVQNYLAKILAGVERADKELKGTLEVELLGVSPGRLPGKAASSTCRLQNRV